MLCLPEQLSAQSEDLSASFRLLAGRGTRALEKSVDEQFAALGLFPHPQYEGRRHEPSRFSGVELSFLYRPQFRLTATYRRYQRQGISLVDEAYFNGMGLYNLYASQRFHMNDFVIRGEWLWSKKLTRYFQTWEGSFGLGYAQRFVSLSGGVSGEIFEEGPQVQYERKNFDAWSSQAHLHGIQIQLRLSYYPFRHLSLDFALQHQFFTRIDQGLIYISLFPVADTRLLEGVQWDFSGGEIQTGISVHF